MQPMQVTIALMAIVALAGEFNPGLTFAKKPEKGVALSLARLHHMRPPVTKVPIRVGNVAMKSTAIRPTAPAVEPVACR